jgi:hypothetical protein
MLVIAVIIRQIPIVSIPFKWLESYFHEISHGLAAIFTGGKVIQIELFTNGAGLCTSQGGHSFTIAFFGYAGAIFWGAMIYSLAGKHQRIAQFFTGLILLLLVFSIVFWVRDLLTMVILGVLVAMFFMLIKMNQLKHIQNLLQLLGLLVLLNSLFSPFYLIDGRELGDGAALAAKTGIPELVWVAVWFILAVIALISLSRSSNGTSSNTSRVE